MVRQEQRNPIVNSREVKSSIIFFTLSPSKLLSIFQDLQSIHPTPPIILQLSPQLFDPSPIRHSPTTPLSVTASPHLPSSPPKLASSAHHDTSPPSPLQFSCCMILDDSQKKANFQTCVSFKETAIFTLTASGRGVSTLSSSSFSLEFLFEDPASSSRLDLGSIESVERVGSSQTGPSNPFPRVETHPALRHSRVLLGSSMTSLSGVVPFLDAQNLSKKPWC